MEVKIYSREAMEELLEKGFLNNIAVISFYTPRTKKSEGTLPIDYTNRVEQFIQVGVPDIDIEVLEEYGLTYDTYFTQVNELAEFVYMAKNSGMDIICQCDYGQSRSAACAAAILEHFYRKGITIFADYRYYPNQLVFNQVFNALEEYKCS